MNAFIEPRVAIRPALPADRESVLEFCKNIWEGHDYVPYVWDEWLADPRGEMFVAEYAGKAVGLARLTNLAPGQWWLEGFRVDPQHQDKRIGSKLHEYLIEHWLEHGDGIIRLWTNSKNVRVHHLCERTGFVKTQERAIYEAESLPAADASALTPIMLEEILGALNFAWHAESQSITGGMLDMGWCMVTPNEDSLRNLMGRPDGCLFWWREHKGLLCLWEDENEENKYLMIALASCNVAALPDLLLDARHFAAQIGASKIAWHVSLEPRLLEILTASGFTCEWDGSNFQFEREHPTRP
jgi:GNAT superfamily N-acetyltransferase